MPVEERFWRNVDKGDGCWMWKLTLGRSKYGTFWLSKRVPILPHRYAWQITYGEIPAGM